MKATFLWIESLKIDGVFPNELIRYDKPDKDGKSGHALTPVEK